jgi:hypothetical protein
MAAVRSPDGRWAKARIISERGGLDGFDPPRLAVTPGGGAVAVWTRARGDDHSVWAAVMSRSGGWGQPRRLARGDTPSVAATNAQGVVAWNENGAGGRGARMRAAWFVQGRWTGPTTIAGGLRGADRTWVVLNGSGRGLVAAVIPRPRGEAVGIYAWPIAKRRFGSARLLNPDADAGYGPADVCTARGRSATVVWADGSGVRARALTTGGSWGPRFQLASEGAFPSCATSAAGDVVAGWIARRSGLAQVSYRAAGTSWSDPSVISKADDHASRLAVGIGETGRAGAYWLAGSNTGGPDTVQAAIRATDGGWTPPAVLARSRLGTGDLAMNGRFGPIAVWPRSGVLEATAWTEG